MSIENFLVMTLVLKFISSFFQKGSFIYIVYVERVVVIVQFFVFIKVFLEEMVVFLRVRIFIFIGEFIQRRSYVNVNMVRILVSVRFSIFTNFIQERYFIDVSFMRKFLVIVQILRVFLGFILGRNFTNMRRMGLFLMRVFVFKFIRECTLKRNYIQVWSVRRVLFVF